MRGINLPRNCCLNLTESIHKPFNAQNLQDLIDSFQHKPKQPRQSSQVVSSNYNDGRRNSFTNSNSNSPNSMEGGMANNRSDSRGRGGGGGANGDRNSL